jgi:glycosyltransferase involved in cell wall biosynthesis
MRTRSSTPRIFYFAPVAVGENAAGYEVPAVRNKVLGVCSAIQAAGGRAVLVSPLAPRSAVGLARPLRVARVGRLPSIQVLSRGKRGLHRLVQLVTLAVAALRLVRRQDIVILYNFFPEYLLAALCLRIRGTRCVIDIEDAPRKDETSGRGLMNRWSYRLLRRIVDRRALIVSDALARQLNLDRYLPVYGVASYFTPPIDRLPLFSDPTIRINLGGAVWKETGGALFADALRILARDHGSRPLHFFVTGHIAKGLFDRLPELVNATQALRLEIAEDLDFDSYRALLDTIDVGLCLKLPSHSIGQTTFPSKVVEIAANGILLVTTPVSDVPLIFDDDCAAMLASEDPAELAALLASLPDRREEMAARAGAGRQRVTDRLSGAAVGRALRTFLED